MLLAVLYWFGKTKKSRAEWLSIGVRFVAGVGVTMIAVGVWYGNSNFIVSPWPIPTVMIAFFVVIVLDNLLVWHSNRTVGRVVGGRGEGDGRGDYSKQVGGDESGSGASGNGSLDQARDVV